MNQKNPFLSSTLAVLLLLIATTQSYAFNYTISFTASGVTTSVGNVQVQNLTKGTTATVPDGNTLILTDLTAVDELIANNAGIQITQNASTGSYTLTFYTSQAGSTQVAAYAIDGRKVVGRTAHLEAGDNSFELSLPTGMYILRVSGTGCAYSTKLQSRGSTATQAEVKFMSNKKVEAFAPQKSKTTATGVTTMSYSAGDQLLYTATSGTYIASVSDEPTGSNTTNFNFSTIPTSAIPAGTFTMGSPETEVNRYSEETQHQVTLTAFRMSKYEITNAQYAAFLNAKSIGRNGLYAAGAYPTQALIYATSLWGLTYIGTQWVPVTGSENAPVNCVTWYGATEYATYIGGTLPTEAQWEYACRAGTTTPFNTGDFLTNLQANYNWAYPYNNRTNNVSTYPGKPQTVGTYAANAYGLYDMHGNVIEWCADWRGTYPITAQNNPTGAATGSARVVRGGCWYDYARDCRSACTSGTYPYFYFNSLGFRVVLVP
ncbi:MAG: SUMF1/EgtB/PvdO family nonheme iron enzyme [Paludibacter sp.]|nr:SUMF1/EgtB/PvdO family nonheme iron enzyme [Paludibacter sp.]